MPPSNFQLVIEALLRTPNVRGFAGEFESTMARIRAQAAAGTTTPQRASKELRSSAAATEAAIQLEGQGGFLSSQEQDALRKHFRQLYANTVRETRTLLGKEVTLATQKQVETEARRQIGRSGSPIVPSLQTDPARNQPSLSPAITRIQRRLAEIALTDLDYIEERAKLVSALRRLRTAENAVAEALESPEVRGERESVRAEQARNRRAAALGVPERSVGRDANGQLRTETTADYEARLDAAKIHQANVKKIHTINTLTDEQKQLQAVANEDQAALNREIKERQLAERRARNGPAGFFRTALNIAHGRPGRTVDAADEQGPVQFLASRLLTTASYGASAALLYGFVNSAREATKQALELQRVTERLRAQFQALGQGDQFTGFRRSLLSIARDTGVAGSDVVEVGLQMKGAFGDTELAVRRTSEAIRAAQISGLPLAEVVDSLTAASISYGVSIDAISDKAIGIEQRFGVLAGASIKSFGDFASTAEEVGLNLNEVAGILGVINQRSGKGLGAITEGLSRVLPQVHDKFADILLLANQDPALRPSLPKLQEEVAGGQSGQVLLTLAGAWDHLGRSTRSTILTMLGASRNAQYLIPLFEGNAKLAEEAARANEDDGKAIAYQAAQHRTLSYELGRLREQFNQIAGSLGRLGLLQGFSALAGLAVGLATGIGTLVRILADLNDAANGIPSRLLAIAFAMAALTKAAAAGAAIRTVLSGYGIGIGGVGRSAAEGEELAAATGGRLAGAGRGALAATGLPAIGGAVGRGLGALGAGGAAEAIAGSTLAATGVGVLAVGAVAGGLYLLSKSQGERDRKEKAANAAAKRTIDSLIRTGRVANAELDKATSDFIKAEQGGPGGPEKLGPGEAYDRLAAGEQRHPSRDDKHKGILGAASRFLGRVGGLGNVFGNSDDSEDVGDEYNKALVEATEKRFKAAVGLGLLGKHATAPEHLSGKKLREAVAFLRGLSTKQKGKVDEAVDAQDGVDKAVADGGANILKSAQQLAQSYADGEIAWDAYIAALKSQIAALGTSPETADAVAALHQQERQALVDHTNALGQLAKTQGQVALGSDPTAHQRAQQQRRDAEVDLYTKLAQPHSDDQRRQAEADFAAAIQQADKADADAAENAAIAHLNFQLAQTEDPQQQARIRQSIAALKVSYANADELDAAKQEQVEAARQARDADRAVQDSRHDLAEAQAGSNDQLLAVIAQDRAKDQVERARGAGTAAQLEAMAAKIRADRQMEDYMVDAARARRELAIAVAESVGDAAKVGQLTVEQANEDLRIIKEKQSKGEADQGDVDRATAAKVKAEAAEKTRARNDRIGDLEYLFDFDKITANELINGLTAELNTIPETNKEARRDIERRIKQLRDDMGKDLSFNLPTTIHLPSLLYETRRLTAEGRFGASGIAALGGAPAAGSMSTSTYNDNRTQQIIIQGGNAEEVKRGVLDALDERPRLGTYAGVY
jgi:hypothetical protein